MAAAPPQYRAACAAGSLMQRCAPMQMRLLQGASIASPACQVLPACWAGGGRCPPSLPSIARDLGSQQPCKRHCVSRPAPRAPPSGRAPLPAPAGRWCCPGPPPRSRRRSRMPHNRIAAPCWPLWWRRERRLRRRRCAGGVADRSANVYYRLALCRCADVHTLPSSCAARDGGLHGGGPRLRLPARGARPPRLPLLRGK